MLFRPTQNTKQERKKDQEVDTASILDDLVGKATEYKQYCV